jgi:tetratricopeptide (TPR) repeat protein
MGFLAFRGGMRYTSATSRPVKQVVQPDAPKVIAHHLVDVAADAEYQNGLKDYEQGKYLAAIPALYKASSADPSAPGPHFYLGMSYFFSGDARLAIRELKMVTALDDAAFGETAHFYLAKAYMKQGDPVDAHRELDLVLGGNGQMKEKALDLKMELTATVQ